MTEDELRSGKPTGNRGVGAAPMEGLLTKLQISHQSMPKTMRRIAEYVLANPKDVVEKSISEIAEATDASEGSIVKFCRQLGLGGYQHLKLSLSADVVQPVQFIHEDLERDDNEDAVVRKIFASGIQTLRDTLSVADPKALAEAIAMIRDAKRVEVFGIGSAAPIAEDAQYRMLRIGLDARVSVDSHVQAISASRGGPEVATLTISHSGSTHETVTATKLAKEAGSKTICITNFGRSPLQKYADVVLYTMARETKFRTEAMTSRIAQLCVVDTLIAGLALADYDRSVDTLQSTFEVLSSKRF